MATFHIFKLNINNALQGIQLESKLQEFCNRKSNKKYSFTNKADMEVLFFDFVKFSGLPSYIFKEFNLKNSTDIKNLLLQHAETLKELGWSFNTIKTLNDTEREKEYRQWKKSADYIPGKQFKGKQAYENYEEPEEELERILVVYNADDPTNPDTTLEYKFIGKIGKNTEHQINMIRCDFCKLTGIDYFKANPCLLSHYLTK